MDSIELSWEYNGVLDDTIFDSHYPPFYSHQFPLHLVKDKIRKKLPFKDVKFFCMIITPINFCYYTIRMLHERLLVIVCSLYTGCMARN